MTKMLYCYAVWEYNNHQGQRMNNKVVNTIQVDRRQQCATNCTMSAVCDSYNYRAADKACELNEHDTPMVANSADMVPDNAWIWGSPNFCTIQ